MATQMYISVHLDTSLQLWCERVGDTSCSCLHDTATKRGDGQTQQPNKCKPQANCTVPSRYMCI